MPQMNILSLIGGAIKASGSPATSASAMAQALAAATPNDAKEGFAPFLSQQAALLQKATKEGEEGALPPGLVANFLQRLSIVIADDAAANPQGDNAGAQQDGQRQSPLIGRIIQLLQQQGQGVATGQNTAVTLASLLKPEQVQELATLLQVSVSDIQEALEQLVAQSNAVVQQVPVQKPVVVDSKNAADEKDKLFDPSQLLSQSEVTVSESAEDAPDSTTDSDQVLPLGVLIQAGENSVALEKIQALFGDALNIVDVGDVVKNASATAATTTTPSSSSLEIPAIAVVSSESANPSQQAAIAKSPQSALNAISGNKGVSSRNSDGGITTPDAASGDEEENASLGATLSALMGASVSANSTAGDSQEKPTAVSVVADYLQRDMDVITRRGMPQSAQNAAQNSTPLPSQSSGINAGDNASAHRRNPQDSAEHPASHIGEVAAKSQGAVHRSERAAPWRDNNDDIKSQNIALNTASNAEGDAVAGFARFYDNENTAIADRLEASHDDAIGSIREAAATSIAGKLADKARQVDRSYLRGDAHAVSEQVLVKIRDLPQPGNHRIQIHLDPNELGKVDVTMDVAADGRTHITMTVDKRETFELLQRDRGSLEKALGDLGLKTDSGSMSFNLREQPKGQQQAAGEQGQQNQNNTFRNQDVLPEELREDMPPLEPYRSYLLNIDESVNISV